MPDRDPFAGGGNEFAAADSLRSSELTRGQPSEHDVLHDRSARPGRRPRYRSATLDPGDWQDYVRESQSSLRVIAEQTGGFATRSTATTSGRRSSGSTLRRSDYYVVGYYSNNPDPLKKRRTYRGPHRVDTETESRSVPADLQDVIHAKTSLSVPPEGGSHRILLGLAPILCL